MKKDWASKLSSRKFWLAVCGLIAGMMLAFGADENAVNNVTGVIMSAGCVIAYIIGEAWTDAAGAQAAAYTDAATEVIEKQQAAAAKDKPPEDVMEDDLR